MRTITWDYDKQIATEWCRLGGCNHCGDCCRITIYLQDRPNSRNGSLGTDGCDLWHEPFQNGQRLLWKVRQIIEDEESRDCYGIMQEHYGGCFEGNKEKGAICSIWPLHPAQVAAFNDCSYRFIKLNVWTFNEKPEQMPLIMDAIDFKVDEVMMIDDETGAVEMVGEGHSIIEYGEISEKGVVKVDAVMLDEYEG